MSEFERLGERVAHGLGGVSDERFEAVRASFMQRAGRASRRSKRRRTLFALAAACGVLAVGLLAIAYAFVPDVGQGSAHVQQAEDLWLEGPKHGAPTRVELGNGAHIDLVAGTRSRVYRAGDGRTRVTLEGGVIEVLVSRDEAAQWAFYAGPYLAKTAGGEFFLNYQPASGTIEAGVTSGRLRVSGGPLGTDSVTLETGQRISAGAGSIVVSSLQDQVGPPLP